MDNIVDLDEFRKKRKYFDDYTSFQAPNKFGKAKYIAVFAPAKSTSSIFLCLYNIKNISLIKTLQKDYILLLIKMDFLKIGMKFQIGMI